MFSNFNSETTKYPISRSGGTRFNQDLIPQRNLMKEILSSNSTIHQNVPHIDFKAATTRQLPLKFERANQTVEKQNPIIPSKLHKEITFQQQNSSNNSNQKRIGIEEKPQSKPHIRGNSANPMARSNLREVSNSQPGNKNVQIQSAISQIQKKMLSTQQVDLCFVIDGTHSMYEWLKATKDKIEEIVDHVIKEYKDTQLNIGLVVYRDHNLKTKSIDTLTFTKDIDSFKSFLGGISTASGVDHPEDVNGGFQKALKFPWSSVTRVLVHLADAPCHGKRFHDFEEDDYNLLKSQSDDKPWEKIFEEMKEKGIDYHFIEINKLQTEKMIREFGKIWNNINDAPGSRGSKIQVHSIGDNVDKLVQSVFTSIKSSIMKSISQVFTSSNKKGLRDNSQSRVREIKLVPKGLNSNKMTTITGYLKKVALNGVTNNDFKNDDLKVIKGESKTIIKRTSPFAAGTFNYAYEAWLSGTNHPLVAKQPKIIDSSVKELMNKDLKKNAIAIHLANKFNDQINQLKGFEWARILFIQSVFFESENGELFILEGEIDGQFEKYSNNLDKIDESREIRHLTAYAHFTYQETRGEYLLTDFQGVNRCLLTDPCVHSKTREFQESGDFGLEGMIYFFRKHKCNELCQKLGLQRPKELDLENPRLKNIGSWKEKVFEHKETGYTLCKTMFCNKLLANGEKNCEFCSQFLKRTEARECVVKECKKKFTFEPYYYELNGMCSPKRCENCRAEFKRDLASL